MLQIYLDHTATIPLVVYIFGGLLMGAFIRRRQFLTLLDETFAKKTNFYIAMRGAILVMVVHLLLFIREIVGVLDEPLHDCIIFFLMYQEKVTSELGIFMFRGDFLSCVFIVLLNLCVLFYLQLMLNYLARTTKTTKYIFEVPILIITVFLAFKYFLLTYDLVFMIIVLELASLCTVILLNLQLSSGSNLFPMEASIKYFLFNAVAVGFMLFAMTGYYEQVSSFNIIDLSNQALLDPYLYLFSSESLLFFHLIFFVGYLMKLGSAPFHFWVPDVYEGAEFLLTAFLILIVSPAMNFKFFSLVKLLLPVYEITHVSFIIFFISGLICIFVGVLNGFTQMRLKRFLAFASISHLGFILLSLGTPNFVGFFAGIFYLLTYVFTNIAFFSVLLLIKRFTPTTYIYLNQFKGVFNSGGLLLGFILIPILSFAGFPPFPGFFSKFFVFVSLMEYTNIVLCLILIILVVVNAYIYLRFLKINTFEQKRIEICVPNEMTPVKISAQYSFEKMPGVLGPVFPFRLKSNFFSVFFLNVVFTFFTIFLPTTCLFVSQVVIALNSFF